MRKGLVGVVAFVALGAVVAGGAYWLTRPAEIGAELPKGAPVQGSCWNVAEKAAASAFPWPEAPVDCAATHTAEIYLVGQVDRTLAAEAASATGDEAKIKQNLMYAQARRACLVFAEKFLGGDWHAGRVQVVADWIKPQRSGHFGCAAVESPAPASNRFVPRTASLRDALKTDALKITCVAGEGGEIVYAACDGPHRGEFVGSYTITPENAPFIEDKVRAAASSGCGELTTTFVGSARTDLRAAYVGPTNGGDWLGSDQTYACYAMAAGAEKLSRSVKGIGSGPLPR